MASRFMALKALCLTFILIFLVSPYARCENKHKTHTPAAQQRFQDIDHWVKMFEDPERDTWQKPAEVVGAMNLKSGDVVADIGAGTGYFTRRFAVTVGPSGKALGLDVEPNMVKYMNEDAKKLDLHNYEARVVRTDDPELSRQSVDVIFLCNTYHHIDNRLEYFSNAAKSLKAQGRIVIVDFYKDTDFGPPRDHKLAKDIVLKEMEKAGYRLIKSHGMLPKQYFLEFGL
jgi:ubiquinone/menaquinone biosynthesis C-methylase UbiE